METLIKKNTTLVDATTDLLTIANKYKDQFITPIDTYNDIVKILSTPVTMAGFMNNYCKKYNQSDFDQYKSTRGGTNIKPADQQFAFFITLASIVLLTYYILNADQIYEIIKMVNNIYTETSSTYYKVILRRDTLENTKLKMAIVQMVKYYSDKAMLEADTKKFEEINNNNIPFIDTFLKEFNKTGTAVNINDATKSFTDTNTSYDNAVKATNGLTYDIPNLQENLNIPSLNNLILTKLNQYYNIPVINTYWQNTGIDFLMKGFEGHVIDKIKEKTTVLEVDTILNNLLKPYSDNDVNNIKRFFKKTSNLENVKLETVKTKLQPYILAIQRAGEAKKNEINAAAAKQQSRRRGSVSGSEQKQSIFDVPNPVPPPAASTPVAKPGILGSVAGAVTGAVVGLAGVVTEQVNNLRTAATGSTNPVGNTEPEANKADPEVLEDTNKVVQVAADAAEDAIDAAEAVDQGNIFQAVSEVVVADNKLEESKETLADAEKDADTSADNAAVAVAKAAVEKVENTLKTVKEQLIESLTDLTKLENAFTLVDSSDGFENKGEFLKNDAGKFYSVNKGGKTYGLTLVKKTMIDTLVNKIYESSGNHDPGSASDFLANVNNFTMGDLIYFIKQSRKSTIPLKGKKRVIDVDETKRGLPAKIETMYKDDRFFHFY